MIMMNGIKSQLFSRLVEDAMMHARNTIGEHSQNPSELENIIWRSELSPLVHLQLVAAAIRLLLKHGLRGGDDRTMLNSFENALSPGAERLRDKIEEEVRGKPLPMELAVDYATRLKHRIAATPGEDVRQANGLRELHDYAALYTDLWRDPRIGARAATRRIMLAMATILRARNDRCVANNMGNQGPALFAALSDQMHRLRETARSS